jgi:hypothetical protein
MMKRNASLISVIGETIAALSFPMTPELVHMLTSTIFTDEFITKEEICKDLKSYFSKVAANISTSEALKALLQDFLLKKFVQTRNSSFTANQRMVIVRCIHSALASAAQHSHPADQETVQSILTSVLEFFLL